MVIFVEGFTIDSVQPVLGNKGDKVLMMRRVTAWWKYCVPWVFDGGVSNSFDILCYCILVDLGSCSCWHDLILTACW